MFLSVSRLRYCLTSYLVNFKYICSIGKFNFQQKNTKLRSLSIMSEPPLKKKRTLLDHFTRTEISKRKGGKKVGTKTMATAAPGPQSEPRVTITEEPGTSKGTEGVADSDVTDEQDTDQVDSQEGLVSSQEIPTKKPSQIKHGSQAYKGTPLKILDRLKEPTGPLINNENHRVLFKLPFKYDGKKPPYPYPSYKDKWDGNHVRMPCSPASEYPGVDKNGHSTVRRRWDMIQEQLLGDIPGPYELEERILLYNSRYRGKWNFDVLNSFFIEDLDDSEKCYFFNNTLKKMATLALQLGHICTAPIPLLRAGRNLSITLSQQQIACLLANAFFCTFPRRNSKTKNSEYYRYPNINFDSLFTGNPSKVKFGKLRCLINYFRRVVEEMPCGTVTYTRQCLDHLPDWDNDDTPLRALHVSSEGTIEDDGDGFLQVDFANMYLGGGVLGHGCVQEEIRFLICPEMLVTRLFTEALGKNECLIMRGCERFSNYDGYASKFEWKESYVDKTPRDDWGRIQCEVVAIDALVIHDHKSQFQQGMVKRELNKAFCGFFQTGGKSPHPAVCTGNWGCGAFGGDKQLKALIQLMAASKAERDLCYFTFDDNNLRDELYVVHKHMTDKLLTIGDLMKMVGQYRRNVLLNTHRGKPKLRLYQYIMSVFDGSLEDTDEDSNQSTEMQHWQEDNMGSEDIGDIEVKTVDSDWSKDGEENVDNKGGKGVKRRQASVDYKANTP